MNNDYKQIKYNFQLTYQNSCAESEYEKTYQANILNVRNVLKDCYFKRGFRYFMPTFLWISSC